MEEGRPKLILSPVELRVLGSLIEKQITTPEYYPLTLNALTAACNQKSNRDPVMALSSDQVKAALESLHIRRIVVPEIIMNERAAKYRQAWTAVAGLGPDETAVMTELILRGPQTVGELRGRCARMHEFADLGQVELTLNGLMEREEPLVAMLPRQTGFKEPRYAHTLGGPVSEIQNTAWSSPSPLPSQSQSNSAAEIVALRDEVSDLRQELADLRAQFREFKKQFE